MAKEHDYRINLNWTGNTGEGTRNYAGYRRDHEISAAGKSRVIEGSSDPHFRGDESRYNPEETLVASLAACHMLWYLHLCADAGIVVVDYKDEPRGKMIETADGGGHFTEVILYPRVVITKDSDQEKALELHKRAHELCFIAGSVNFPVKTKAEIIFEK